MAFYENRARVGRAKGKRLQRWRGERLERTFAHVCETGGARRTRLRGRENVEKRYLLQAAAANLGLVMRSLFGMGTPRGWAERLRVLLSGALDRLGPITALSGSRIALCAHGASLMSAGIHSSSFNLSWPLAEFALPKAA